MDRNIVLRKIIDGTYDMRIPAFVQSYDDIFMWMISREKSNTLSTNIYSIDWRLVWDDDIKILEPYLSGDHLLVRVNNNILPRYGLTLIHWLKNMHMRFNILSDYFIKDVNQIIIRYIL